MSGFAERNLAGSTIWIQTDLNSTIGVYFIFGEKFITHQCESVCHFNL